MSNSVSIPLRKKKIPEHVATVIEDIKPKRTKAAKPKVEVNPFPLAAHEESIQLIDIHPQIGKLSRFGDVIYLNILTVGSTNSSRFEPARSITITGKDNIRVLAEALNKFLAE